MAIAACMSLAVGTAVAQPSDLNIARAATGQFHDIPTAEHAGYGLPPAGAPLHECISNATGTMGFHWVNGGLLDATVDPAHPEALVYYPDKLGNLHLGALEYVVFQADWAAARQADPSLPPKPVLYGHEFGNVDAVPGSNLTIFAIPPFYQLHVWLWKANPLPDGLFQPFNPALSCDGAAAAAAKYPQIGTVNARLAAAVGRFGCHIRARDS
jgi:hypothetical protein